MKGDWLMLIQAAVVHEKGQEFVIEDVQIKEPKANEVLVRIVASGICHSDEVVRNQIAPIPLPAVLGHEGSGIVEKIGSGVQSVQPGDHVILTFSSCGHCKHCLKGRPAYCLIRRQINFSGKAYDGTHRFYLGDQPLSNFNGQGSFATFAVVHERNVVKVDKDIDIALLGPLGCGLSTGSGTVLNRLQPDRDSSIAVFGCGAVGLSAIMAAKIIGCSCIIAIDLHEKRLELAKELGATHVINPKQVNVVEQIRSITDGGADYALETAGVAQLVPQALESLGMLGTLAVVGLSGEVQIHVQQHILADGKTVTGVIQGDIIPQLFIPKLVEYYKEGKFPFDKMVKFYEFEEINQAFEDSKSGETIKPILKMPMD
jgi:aryl-alcohol dehydrogenase